MGDVRWDALFKQSDQVFHSNNPLGNYMFSTTEIIFNINVNNTKASTNLDWVATGKSFFSCNRQRGSLFGHHFACQLPPSSWHALAHRK